MVIEVFLKDKDDIERLNKVACEQPFDMSVSYGYTIFDAKSLLALYTLVGKSVYIVAPDELDYRRFAKVVKKMKLVA